MRLRLALGLAVVLAGTGLAVPAGAVAPVVTFECCQYTASVTRIAPNASATIQPATGVTFADHPLVWVTDNTPADNPTSGTTPVTRTFPAPGIYRFYCSIHGFATPDGSVGGMSGQIVVTNNQPPTASFSLPATATAGQPVTLDASASTDDHGISAYRWNFGDGATATTATPTTTHAFAASSTVTLTVVDDNADAVGPESATTTHAITVPQPGQPPAGTTPPTTTTTTTPPPSGGGADHAAPHVTLTTRTLHLASLRAGHAKLSFTSSEAGSATLTVRLGSTTIATATVKLTKGGAHTLTIKLTSKGRARLRHAKHVALRLSLVVRDAAGNHTTKTLSLSRVS